MNTLPEPTSGRVHGHHRKQPDALACSEWYGDQKLCVPTYMSTYVWFYMKMSLSLTQLWLVWVLRMKLKGSHMLSKHFTTELRLQLNTSQLLAYEKKSKSIWLYMSIFSQNSVGVIAEDVSFGWCPNTSQQSTLRLLLRITSPSIRDGNGREAAPIQAWLPVSVQGKFAKL